MSVNWKISAMKLLIIGALIVLCALSTSVKPVSAASLSSHQAATSCYGGASSFHVQAGSGANIGPYWTSSRCNDINLRFSSIPQDIAVDVCWTQHNYCRSRDYGYTIISAGDTSWYAIATDVKDGTEFTVHMFALNTNDATVSGYVAS